jgi:tripartite-type tricarboxylate transporter receptor subunit TctC
MSAKAILGVDPTNASRRQVLGELFGFGAIAAMASPARLQAQVSSPTTPLRLIVPFTPGTGIDLIARTLGPRLSERLARPVVVENRPGASGNLGTEAVVRAPANGQTLLVSVNTLVMNRSLYSKLTFDPLKDLAPVTLTSWGQLVLVAHPGAGFKSAGELVSAARLRPGAINYASPGVGTPHHLSMELLKETARVFITHIPYSGTGPAVTDVLGGHVPIMFLPIHVALPHIKSGRLLGLAVGSDQRHRLLPQVPTLSEAKVGSLNVDMWYGIFAPAGTATEWISRINREVGEILAMPEVRTAFETQGMEPAGSSAAEFAALVERDAKRWASLIKTRGITAE